MKQLSNRHILLGISGGIAAYKSAELVRRLKDHGADVRVVMTAAAMEFITPLTLQALSGNPVHTTLLDPEAEAGMGHIELARWADLILVAPASADLMARLASGRGDDLLTTLCLATPAPVALAPAMNQGMWRDPATQANVEILRERGIALFGPAAGEQACGDVGPGRMLEAEQLAELAAGLFQSRALDGVKLCITAGPTREAIDPVRYISNHSSGKMGYALAEAAADAGAQVTLISGPTQLPCPERVTRIDVISAQQMYDASLEKMGNCDIFIACAAVADYRPANVEEQKIKKHNDAMRIELVRNPDIVSAVASHPKRPFTVGFAAETQDVVSYARDKLQRKKLDLIVANDVSDSRIGFNTDDNRVTVIGADTEQHIEQMSKRQLARQLIALIAQQHREPAD
ncbi:MULTISPECIES: bifunctional phosphopantothenoylcysteine decarboxylase/phosphopantothenate--cysteine ligase CoaBC [Spongiibacter]|uniref:bifunctional phosphopantothenoylcysteine decarboxylase/phosphopantothenate--cysteine ligase CoaBC n=1 Tax=Spongiibacter TaxID=630749 RepID=UPI000C3A72F9|nr:MULTISPECIES: bifunctional phosphopantothenoylcysteine decarboxylase/phosphopantothenate--cysteine ligase CoaBC [Spongiibacter]MAY38076.1 bifunctional phosphopantothenoylcysteine decarboxylase/phosphopantothenate--cysteine ligase CoaBC [Spongiibacter sp.]MBI59428.1 bifunctional phosphopantothenoylcysteine decarboxylase/phosphopantothenate--cysteine ligase CoaBC [Spongiibacter sp.]MBO6753221.1 bifunctional phosphopantothenoylcysteine decarboxylase/phosphopantothenate--cysteine ligase CoaBC [Sp|tara:strand:- start:28524 stop:29729 length:1206 start_codon:yes stop_codon:yes gene_type:complete